MSCCENCQHHDYCEYSAKDSKAMTYCSSKYDDTPAKDSDAVISIYNGA